MDDILVRAYDLIEKMHVKVTVVCMLLYAVEAKY